jgi:hypothetical protein
MKRSSGLQVLMVLSASLVLAGTVGCQPDSPAGSTAGVPRVSPEESFNEIARVMTKAVGTGAGGVPSGFVSSDEDSRSRFVVNNEVTSQLIPPTNGSSNYRGTITVTSRSYYSFRHAEGAKGEGGKEPMAEAGGEDFNILGESVAADEFGATNDGLISAAPTAEGETPGKSSERVEFREDKDVRTFELVYENGRWVLKTPPNPETEQAVIKAFDYALSQQR